MLSMLFRRRQPLSYSTRLRELLWPRKGFSRPFQYFGKRVLRLSATPHAVAAGIVAGVVSSLTPFIGFHFLIAFAIAYVVSGNMLAAALGTAVGNPLTFPLIWAVTWEVGHRLLGKGDPVGDAVDLEQIAHVAGIAHIWQPVLKPMLVGAVPLAVLSVIIVYPVTYIAVDRFQRQRRARLSERARARLTEALEGTSV
jgi:uncharacterized protein (DUF2062 family)